MDAENEMLAGLLKTFMASGGEEAVKKIIVNFYDDLCELPDFSACAPEKGTLISEQVANVCQGLSKVAETGSPESVADFSIHSVHKKFNFTSGQITTSTEFFLQALKKALPDELFVEVSKLLVLSDKTVLAGLATQEGEEDGEEDGDAEKEAADAAAQEDLNNLDLQHKFKPSHISLIQNQMSALISEFGSLEAAGEYLITQITSMDEYIAKLFSGAALRVQGFKFLSQIARWVTYLADPDTVESDLYNLGIRHLGYVTQQDFARFLPAVIQCMQKAIKDVLDEQWSALAAESWKMFLGYAGGHLLTNLTQLSGKVGILNSSWSKLSHRTDEENEAVREAMKRANQSNSDSGKGFQLSKEQVEAKEAEIAKYLAVFGESFFFNLAVMSKDLFRLFHNKQTKDLNYQFGLAMNMLVERVSDPEELNEQLHMLALRHINYGSRKSHFEAFGQALLVTLRSLLPRDWNRAHEDAWGWFWGICARYKGECIEDGIVASAMIDDTQKALKGVDYDVLCEKYIDKLFDNVEVAQFFNKPKFLFKFIITQILGLITTLYHAPRETCNQIRALGMRHIQYSPPEHLLPVVGVALIYTFSAMLEGFWTEEVEFGWCKGLEYIARTLARAINKGSNPITACLLKNDAKGLELVLTQAPRCERAKWILEVSAIGATLSPFYWCLVAGKGELLDTMLKDLCQIRADSEEYYSGIQELFKLHPGLITKLVWLRPKMIPQLMDGLQWISPPEGKNRRMIYYVEHLYGNPHLDRFADSAKTPINMIMRAVNATECFSNIVMQFVLDHKWDNYAQSIYVRGQLPYMFNITVFVLAYKFLVGEAQRVLRIAVSVVAIFILAFVQIPRIHKEKTENRSSEIDLGFVKFKVIPFFARPVNVIRFVVNIIQAVCIISDREIWHEDHDNLWGAENEILVTQIHHWFMTIIIVAFLPMIQDTFILSKDLGRVKVQIGGCCNELPIVMPVLAILYIGFSGAILCCETSHKVLMAGLDQQRESNCHLVGEGYLCGHTPDYLYDDGNPVAMHNFKMKKFGFLGQETFLDTDSLFYTADGFMDHSHSIVTLLMMSFSNYGLVATGLSLEEEFFLIIFMVCAVMYYMNILVAGFSAKAYYIYEEIESLLAMEKTKEIVEIESLMTKETKTGFWDSMHFEKQVPFMLGDTGLPGGIETQELLTSRYVAPEQVDNILRFTGKADKDLPWPIDNSDNTESAEAQLDKQLRGLRKLYKQARQILRSESGHGSGSGQDGSSNDNSDED
jgi:hemoglobin-like flavoprotein